jgi:protein-export membrane protein SecD
MIKTRLLAVSLILIGVLVGYFNYASEVQTDSVFSRFPFKLGLDLQGGSHLIYRADISNIEAGELAESMNSLRDVIERRVNLFGVSEPRVQIEEKGRLKSATEREYRLIVELPGVTDLAQAVAMIGETPLLEFMVERPDGAEKEAILEAYKKAKEMIEAGGEIDQEILNNPLLRENPYYIPTELTGAYLKKARLEFGELGFEPKVGLEFNKEGAELFAKLTKDNVGKRIAIFLDRHLGNLDPISAPVVQEEIRGGTAEISGGFTAEEAKLLVGRLNSGALPVPIELISEQGIGATLGKNTLKAGITAGIYGIVFVALFLIFWYRLPGILAILALSIYIVLMLAIFKFIGVTLTAAGIAGFILSIGMAVDANILIFERIKEEIRSGKMITGAISDGFSRAWNSIRDANISSIITAIILFWFGTSLVKGFALTFGIGVLVSMFSAVTVTRTFLFSLGIKEGRGLAKFLLGSGIK